MGKIDGQPILELIFQIQRSQKAYDLYLKNKYYYQALRILSANKEIYRLLTENAGFWTDDNKDKIIGYIFHLEDWFQQFEQLRKTNNPTLETPFVFIRLQESIPFPKDILECLKGIKL